MLVWIWSHDWGIGPMECASASERWVDDWKNWADELSQYGYFYVGY